MSQGVEQQYYRGVKCLRCTQPITISPLVASIEAELQDDETATPRHRKCEVFHLRCVACGKEKPYRSSEIHKFQGVSSTTAIRAEPASAPLLRLRNVSRVANA